MKSKRQERAGKQHQPARRRMSAGTVLMLAVTLLVVGGSALVLTRLSGNDHIDTSRLQAEIRGLKNTETTSETQHSNDDASVATAASSDYGTAGNSGSHGAEIPSPSAAIPQTRSFTMTVGGTVSVDGEVRKNSYLSDLKVYELSDIMMLLRDELSADVNIVFLENLLSRTEQASDLVATGETAGMLRNAGINMAACGFARSWDKGAEMIRETQSLLQENRIEPVGIFGSAPPNQISLRNINGIRTAILQYTDTIASGTRKKMNRQEQSHMVPEADPTAIAEDIAEARRQGAEAVIVLIEWGSINKAPSKAQREKAQMIADAGADLIFGNGSRIPLGTEMITAQRADGSQREVLCTWSLGTVLSGERGSVKRLSGYLVHVTLQAGENGDICTTACSYTPVYTWKYKQDGRYYYRCLASDHGPPDGMANDQARTMEKARKTVEDALKDSPLQQQ